MATTEANMEESAQAVAQAVAMATEAKSSEAPARDGAESTPAPAPQDFSNPPAATAPAPEAQEQPADTAQQRPVTIAPATYPAATGTSPAVTHPAPGGNLPTCQNCGTHTTPLWRRDEHGAVLCNACGLFLKLHNRPRPISLKTDVIKSRNRIKTHRPDLAKQKKAQAQAQHLNPQAGDLNGADLAAMNGAVARRTSQKANGVLDDTNSPISRTGTPNLYAPHVPMYSNIDDQFQAQQLSAFADGRATSPLGGDIPQTQEQLIATNSSLKTRVSELEVIQELYRGRIQQLEQEEANRQVAEKNKTEVEEQLHAQINTLTETNAHLQKELEESHRRENMLKRRLDELEVELKEAKEALAAYEGGRSKKPRVDDGETAEKTETAETAAPQTAEAAP